MKRSATGKHPSEDTLRAMGRGESVDTAHENHVAACSRCTDEVNMYRGLAEVLGGRISAGACPDSELLVGMESGQSLPEGVRTWVNRHLNQCVECAAEFEALGRISEGGPELPVAVPVLAAATQSIIEKLKALASWSMPLSLAATTRSVPETTGDEKFHRAMAEYRAERYEVAAAGLEEASREPGGQRSEVSFYLGVSLLKIGQLHQAVAALEDAVRRPPRLGEYHWYLAQAYLESGRGEEALKHLKKAARLPGSYQARAKDLAKEVAEILRDEEPPPD